MQLNPLVNNAYHEKHKHKVDIKHFKHKEMKNGGNFFLYALLFIGVLAVHVCGCRKDDIAGEKSNNTGNTFTDPRDGSVYQIITIDNQLWMAENLKYLPNVNSHSSGSYMSPVYYVYGYDGTDTNVAKATLNYRAYGVLYNWPAAMAGSESSTTNPSGVKGVCPNGWHLPSDSEWSQLTDFLSGQTVAGGKLKEAGTTHWNSTHPEATNETGFTALPAGYRCSNGPFLLIGDQGYWWGATASDSKNAWSRSMTKDYKGVWRSNRHKAHGFSVRCVKD